MLTRYSPPSLPECPPQHLRAANYPLCLSCLYCDFHALAERPDDSNDGHKRADALMGAAEAHSHTAEHIEFELFEILADKSKYHIGYYRNK